MGEVWIGPEIDDSQVRKLAPPVEEGLARQQLISLGHAFLHEKVKAFPGAAARRADHPGLASPDLAAVAVVGVEDGPGPFRITRE